MSNAPKAISGRRRRYDKQNKELALQFAKEAFADPSRLDNIPFGATLVVLPADDPELTEYNLKKAERLAAEGRTVHIEQVGVQEIDEEGWKRLNAKPEPWSPTWATDLDPADTTIVYDRERDLLCVDIAGGRRRQTVYSVHKLAGLLVDINTGEACGYMVQGFLAYAVPRVPRLANILAVAELRALTEEELGGIEWLEPLPGFPTLLDKQSDHRSIEARNELLAAIDQLTAEPVTFG